MQFFKCSLLIVSLLVVTPVTAQQGTDLTAEEIMAAVKFNLKNEQYVYEEISAILTDQLGQRDTRQLRKFTRISDDGVIKFLLVFDEPEEYEG
ncbi:MAG: hypothetical protein HKN08_00925, partial [Gammaproteobacteria bacterium]|nr:hypothetical protein [Gammaproteobacteria bacterium]